MNRGKLTPNPLQYDNYQFKPVWLNQLLFCVNQKRDEGMQ